MCVRLCACVRACVHLSLYRVCALALIFYLFKFLNFYLLKLNFFHWFLSNLTADPKLSGLLASASDDNTVRVFDTCQILTKGNQQHVQLISKHTHAHLHLYKHMYIHKYKLEHKRKHANLCVCVCVYSLTI